LKNSNYREGIEVKYENDDNGSKNKGRNDRGKNKKVKE
jgi:hypothetical protein